MNEPTFEELDSLGFDLWSRARPSNTRDLWGALDEGERSYWRSVARLAWPLRAQNAELTTAMARALDLIKTQAQHRADHGSQSEPLPWISEAYRVIDAALAAAGQPQGSGK